MSPTISNPDTCIYDLPLELMKLSVKAGSSQFYQKAAQKVREKLQWGEKKFTRVVNNTDQMLEIELVVAQMTIKEIAEELGDTKTFSM